MAEVGLDLAAETIATGKAITIANGGKEPSIEEAINATLKKFEKIVSAPVEQPAVKKVVRKDTLPSVSGSNSNAIDFNPTTLGDLQKELDKLRTIKL